MTSNVDVFLQPGQYFVGNANHTIRTLLGSCVSMTLWHPTRKIGAMSHFLLPARAPERSAEDSLDGKYGDEALQLMLGELRRLDVPPSQCLAKVFGGGSMFPQGGRDRHEHIGRKNGAAARRMLQAHRIEIVSEHLFGVGHRQIIFEIGSGDVWARQVQPAA